jgi:hypothetical protein
MSSSNRSKAEAGGVKARPAARTRAVGRTRERIDIGNLAIEGVVPEVRTDGAERARREGEVM